MKLYISGLDIFCWIEDVPIFEISEDLNNLLNQRCMKYLKIWILVEKEVLLIVQCWIKENPINRAIEGQSVVTIFLTFILSPLLMFVELDIFGNWWVAILQWYLVNYLRNLEITKIEMSVNILLIR